MSAACPADPAAVRSARRLLRVAAGRVVVASHNDADGLAGAVTVRRALAAHGVIATAMPARRGEHVHQDAMRARLRTLALDTLVVVDMGSRPGVILDAVPTLVIDHHDATGGVPPNAVVVNGFDREPVAPASVLAYVVCQAIPGSEASVWLAALGAVADLGTAERFEPLIGFRARGGAWSKAVSLINAARRAPEDDAQTALEVLAAATGPQDITNRRVPGADRLEGYRRAVQAEVARCSRVAPVLLGEVALIRCASAAQVHPVLASRWSWRLAPAIVVVGQRRFPGWAGELRRPQSPRRESAGVAARPAIHPFHRFRIRAWPSTRHGWQPCTCRLQPIRQRPVRHGGLTCLGAGRSMLLLDTTFRT